ncbi:MAG: methionine adenosyltransferase [Patescibacteria group bacterium]
MRSHLFTSESVTEGHPDKICDQISDGILDAYLSQDPYSRVAVEAGVKDNHVFLLGEVTSAGQVDAGAVARNVIRSIGYTDPALGFSAEGAEVHVHLSAQSADIAQGVFHKDGDIGAGDQGLMFGYADRQTEELMPLPIMLAHALTRRLTQLRREGALAYLRPDGKSQVTVRYEDGVPREVTTVVISTQHNEDVSLEDLREAVREQVINPLIPENLRARNMVMHINPGGRFVIGGPVGDSGVTGRKIIVDTYGGWSRHGGGAFSGKDPTKVDRSAAYAARQAAKSVVAAGLAERCEIQLAYALGVAQPVSLHVTTFGTGSVSDEEIEEQLSAIDFRPGAIISRLGLRRPAFQATAAYGHFGRGEFAWEVPIPLLVGVRKSA